jgi:hypothetical protein
MVLEVHDLIMPDCPAGSLMMTPWCLHGPTNLVLEPILLWHLYGYGSYPD